MLEEWTGDRLRSTQVRIWLAHLLQFPCASIAASWGLFRVSVDKREKHFAGPQVAVPSALSPVLRLISSTLEPQESRRGILGERMEGVSAKDVRFKVRRALVPEIRNIDLQCSKQSLARLES